MKMNSTYFVKVIVLAGFFKTLVPCTQNHSQTAIGDKTPPCASHETLELCDMNKQWTVQRSIFDWHDLENHVANRIIRHVRPKTWNAMIFICRENIRKYWEDDFDLFCPCWCCRGLAANYSTHFTEDHFLRKDLLLWNHGSRILIPLKDQ